MSRACVYCESSNDSSAESGPASSEIEWTDGGSVGRCRRCGRSHLAAAPVAERADGQVPAPRLQRVASAPRGAPGETPSLPAAAAGLAFTVFFYSVLSRFPGSMLHEIFFERGWVPYVITGISSWALCLLVSKLHRLRSEASVLDLDLIRTPGGGALRAVDCDFALDSLDALSATGPRARESFLATRLSRALRHFRARRRVAEVIEFLAAESRSDDLRVDASYGLVRVFVWAVPTLGFIGTVIGIGAAVGGFSETLEAASSLENMKESIGSVTGGLGVAFDTTLLALVMSMLIMFPANAVQRFEERILGQIDDYCTENLVQRLEDDDKTGGTTDDEGDRDLQWIDLLADRLAAALRERGD